MITPKILLPPQRLGVPLYAKILTMAAPDFARPIPFFKQDGYGRIRQKSKEQYESYNTAHKRIQILLSFELGKRMHVHVVCADGEAKVWLEPIVSLAMYYKLNSRRLTEIQEIVEARKNEIVKEWKKYFSID